MAEESRVVDRHLRVESADDAVRRHDQRVDLAERRVALDEAPVERLRDPLDLLALRLVGNPREQLARVMRLVPLERIDVHARERRRVLGRDLLDLDPAVGREHEERLPGPAVERHREVVLARDLGGRLDPEPLDAVPADVETEDLARARPEPRPDPAASFTPPAFPRPPVSTWALTTTGPPSSAAAARASSALNATRPAETGMPYLARSSFPWCSYRSTARQSIQARDRAYSAAVPIADQLTLARIACAPLVVVLFSVNFSRHDYWGTAVFCVAMSTDWFDGRIARRSGRTTSFGSLLDPVADKVLVLATLVVLLDQGVFPAWMVAAIVARELLVSGLRLAALERGVVIAARDLGQAEDVVAGDRRGSRRARSRRRSGARASRGGSCSSRSR